MHLYLIFSVICKHNYSLCSLISVLLSIYLPGQPGIKMHVPFFCMTIQIQHMGAGGAHSRPSTGFSI